jgi:rubrerythrin
LTDLAKRQIQPDPQAVQKVAMGGNLSDALDMAAAMEQDAINFYQGLANQLPTCAEAIEAIVEQERRHLTTIRMMRTAGS